MKDYMKKATIWGFVLLASLALFDACKNFSEFPDWWANSTWQYDGEDEDGIILGENRLTYYNQSEGRRKDLPVTVTEQSTGELERRTANTVGPEERILAWIIDENSSDLSVYAIIYCPIIFNPDGTWRDKSPQKLMILEPEIHAKLKVKSPFIYIREQS
jgi:hypothetical protein